VHRDWTKRLEQSPGDSGPQLESALAGLTHSKLPPGVMTASLGHVTFTDDPLKDTFQTMQGWSLELRVIKRPASLDGLFDTSILESLR
jgi:hypothetical protein